MSRNALKKQTLLQIYGIVTLTVLIIAAIWTTSITITKKYISRPLLKLQESASLIALGDLNTFIDKNSRGEIGILAQHLDAMLGSIKQLFGELSESKQKLEEYSRTLEQNVETRTRELARSVEELKALGEISRAVSSTLDLEVVLSSIVRHAVQLSKASLPVDLRRREHILYSWFGWSSLCWNRLVVLPGYFGYLALRCRENLRTKLLLLRHWRR